MNPESRDVIEKALANAIAERAKLDEWIAATQKLLGIEGDQTVPTASTATPGAPTGLRGDSFFGMTLVGATKKYLSMKREPQTTSQIVNALKQGGLTVASKDLGNTLYSVLHREWKKNGEVVRVNDQWGLGDWYPGLRRKGNAKPAKESEGEGEEQQDEVA